MAHRRTDGNGNGFFQPQCHYGGLAGKYRTCLVSNHDGSVAGLLHDVLRHGLGRIGTHQLLLRTERPGKCTPHGKSGFHIILAMIVITGIPIFLLRHYIGGWFTNDEAVSLMVAQLIIPFLLYQFGDGLQINFANALRGIADVRPMMLFSFIAYFLISLPAGYLFGFVCGWGAIGIWAAFPFGLTSAGIMYYLRFRYKTKSIR